MARAFKFTLLVIVGLTTLSLEARAQQPAPTLLLKVGEIVTVRIAQEPAGFIVINRGTTIPEDWLGEPSLARLSLDNSAMFTVENRYGRSLSYGLRTVPASVAAPANRCTKADSVTMHPVSRSIERIEISAPSLAASTPKSCGQGTTTMALEPLDK